MSNIKIRLFPNIKKLKMKVDIIFIDPPFKEKKLMS